MLFEKLIRESNGRPQGATLLYDHLCYAHCV